MSRPYFALLEMRRLRRRMRLLHRRQIRDLSNPFELPNEEFRRIYRVSKEMALYICDELEVDLRPKPTFHNDGLPVHIKVLTCVKILGDGSYQRGAGQDHTLCIGQTTVSTYMSQFTEAVQRRLMGKWVIFPGTETSRQFVAAGFSEKFRVPSILGCIDCTHVKIAPPPFPHGVQYLNRKGVHSINVQLINCKETLEITEVQVYYCMPYKYKEKDINCHSLQNIEENYLNYG